MSHDPSFDVLDASTLDDAGLKAALEKLQVGHSSEFGLAYDDLPFWPRQSSVLQVPVHPVSLGIFLNAV